MTAKRIQLTGFAPDLAQDTPGAIVASNRVIPTSRGFTSGVQTSATNIAVTLNSAPTGTFIAKKQDATLYYYVGSGTKLQQVTNTGGTLTDRSAKSYSSTLTFDGMWSFAQFGDKTLAVNKFDTLQAASTGSASFADVSGAPKAAVVMTVGPPNATFAMLANYNDGTDNPHGLFWSAIGDYTSWTPSAATQCGNVPVLEPTGPFTAGIRFRDGAVLFKEDSMFLATYVGSPLFWQIQCIARDVGCTSKQLVCSAGDRIFFADKRGIWQYDGSYPQLIPGAVHDFWSRQLHPINMASVSNSQCVWDPYSHNLWVCGTAQAYMVWNAISGLWAFHGKIAKSGSPGSAPLGTQMVGFEMSSGTIRGLMVYWDSSAHYYFDVFTFRDAFATNEQTVSLTMGQQGDPLMYTRIKRVAPVWLSPWPAVIGSYTPVPNDYVPDAHASCVIDGDTSLPASAQASTGNGDQSTTSGAISADGRYFDVNASGNYLTVTIKDWNKGEFRDVILDIEYGGTA